MIVHIPGATPEEVIQAMDSKLPVNTAAFEAAPGTVRLERMAKPIARNGYWELTYNFTILPPMIGEGI